MKGHVVEILDRGDSPLELLRAGCAAIWASGLAIYGLQVPEEDNKELATLDGCVAYLSPKLQGKVLKVGV